MKMIARTALLGLLIGAIVSSMCLAGDPTSSNASGIAPVAPAGAAAPPFSEPAPMPGLLPVPPSPNGPSASPITLSGAANQPSATQPPAASGHVQVDDGPAGNVSPSNGPPQ